MRNVVFCAPFLGVPATLRFAKALRSLDHVRLLAVCQERPPPQVQAHYDYIEVVPDALHAGQLFDGVERLRQRFGAPTHILGILEDLQVQLAHLRTHYGLPGAGAEAAERFRDKGRMKDALRELGIPCARHRVLTSPEQALQQAHEVGFPLVIKPPAGAGSRGTFVVRTAGDLERALPSLQLSPTRPMLAEEFLEGQEFSFETLCIRGEPVFHSIGRYYPGPLEVTRTEWMQWVCVLPRDISGTEFDPVRQVGFDAVQRLGMGSGMTHMEWFRRPDGSVAVGEIAMRPPGAQFVSLVSWAHDTDMYRAWARAVVDEAFDGPFERSHAVAIAYLRGHGAGRTVAAVEGLEQAQRQFGPLVVETRLPTVGAPRSSSYEGDGYVILRHPETPVVRDAVKRVIEQVRVRYTTDR